MAAGNGGIDAGQTHFSTAQRRESDWSRSMIVIGQKWQVEHRKLLILRVEGVYFIVIAKIGPKNRGVENSREPHLA